MEERPLAFVPNHHPPSDGALASIGGGSVSVTVSGGGGGIALITPSSPPLREPDAAASNSHMRNINFGMHDARRLSDYASSDDRRQQTTGALHLSTYTAGEDGGRLAMLAKEFGLARMRPPKRQIRKHAFKAFLRNHPDNLNEDITTQEPTIRSSSIECTGTDIPQSNELSPPVGSSRHPPLRFVFSGYSLWLELEQHDIDVNGRGDLDRAMIEVADRFNLGGSIPSPHVTALYGIDTIADEEEMLRLFREDVTRVLLEEAEKRSRRRRTDESLAEGGNDDDGKVWPDLDATGIIVDVEFDGVKGGTMDMAWAEVSFATSPEHEAILNALHEIFYRRSSAVAADGESSFSSDEEKKDEYVPRSNPWAPHLSLCYDNPEGLGRSISRTLIEEFMKEKCPTLSNVLIEDSNHVKLTRAVSGISLWRTAGRMDEWKCLDRYEFPSACLRI